MKLSNRLTNIIAITLLGVMFITAFFSMKGDSMTMDELAHTPAGYSYLTQQDFRINPEHPPLIKDLAAIPLLGLDLNFPIDHASWTDEINGQWWLGSQFVFNSGNDADAITFWSRIPMILVLLFLGWFLFFWARQLGGNKLALFVLTLFSFSPTFLAHGRLVTTDVGAALGIVLAAYFWLKFLKNPSRKNVIFAGLIFGVVMLLKFSLALLLPFFVVITITYALLKNNKSSLSFRAKQIFKYAILSALIGIIGLVFVILPVYYFHCLNYPVEKQVFDTQTILESNSVPVLKDVCLWMSDKPIIRGVGHYLFGLLMATQRTTSGNTVYFFGDVSASGWWYYFPVVYALKVPLAFHVLTLLSLFSTAYLIKPRFYIEFGKRIQKWLLAHFVEFSMFVFLIIYWFTSMSGNLNIGIRHVLPTFPFIYILVGLGIMGWIAKIKKPPLKKIAAGFVCALMGFYVISSVFAYPHYLSYFNETVGGSENGYKYVVDSNYCWGQDLKRLAHYAEKNNIDKIYIDYFGGSDTKYYLKEKYESWQGGWDSSQFPKNNYLAVSATLLQGGRGFPVHGFNQSTTHYKWLDEYEPVDRIGYSIFLYYID